MKLLGQDVIFSLAGCPIAFSTGCDIETNTDFIEVCSPVSGSDREYIPNTFGWSISANYLCSTLADQARLIALQRANTRFEVRIFDRELSTVLTGYCYIKSLHLTANKGNLAKFSATYQPTGGLVPAEPMSISEYTWQVADVVLEGYDATHKFVEAPVDGVKVWKLDVKSLSRLRIEQTFRTPRPFYILCQLELKGTRTEQQQVEDMITDARDHGMLKFYAENEIAHSHVVDGSGLPVEKMDELLNPGVYYVISTEGAFPEMSLLPSLPQ